MRLTRLHGRRAVLAASIAGVLFIAPALFAQGGAESAQPPTISVTGTGTASAPPDVAVVRLGVEARNTDVKKALAEASLRTTAVMKALRGDGVSDSDIGTVDYSVQFMNPSSNGPGAASTKGGPPGYFRINDIASVTVRDLSRLGTILDDALAAGANEVQGISFEISDPTSIERIARAKAFAQAHARAAQIARLAGVTLGRLLHAGMEGSSPVPQSGFRAAAFAAPSVSPGSLKVTVTLQVVYAIQ